MQDAYAFLDKAIEAVLHALALVAALTGVVVWQTKRAGKEGNEYRKDLERLTREVSLLKEQTKEIGQLRGQVEYLKGLVNGERRERT